MDEKNAKVKKSCSNCKHPRSLMYGFVCDVVLKPGVPMSIGEHYMNGTMPAYCSKHEANQNALKV